MLNSVQEFTNGFFEDNSHPITREAIIKNESKEPRDRKIKRRLPPSKYGAKSDNSHRYEAINKKIQYSRNRRKNNRKINKPRTITDTVKQYTKKIPNLTKYLFSIFSNNDETISKLRKSCYNMSINGRYSSFNCGDEYFNIKKRIENSEAFRSKLSELKYDKEQIQKLRRSQDFKSKIFLHENVCAKSIEDDKIFLLKNENRLLKRDLEATLSELNIAKRRLHFTLDQNKRLMKDMDILKIQLNDYELREGKTKITNENVNVNANANGLSSPSSLKPTYRKQRKKHNFNINSLNDDIFRDVDNFDNLSPIRVDYSRYSDDLSRLDN